MGRRLGCWPVWEIGDHILTGKVVLKAANQMHRWAQWRTGKLARTVVAPASNASWPRCLIWSMHAYRMGMTVTTDQNFTGTQSTKPRMTSWGLTWSQHQLAAAYQRDRTNRNPAVVLLLPANLRRQPKWLKPMRGPWSRESTDGWNLCDGQNVCWNLCEGRETVYSCIFLADDEG